MSNRPPPPPNINNNSSWNEKKECNAAMEEAFRVEESGEAPQGEEDVQRAMEGYARIIRQNAANTQSTSSNPPTSPKSAQFTWASPPQNAFALFWREIRPEIMAKYDYGSNPVDVNQEVAKRWKWLSITKIEYWLEQFRELKEEYLKTHPNYRFRLETIRISRNRLMSPCRPTNQNRQTTPFQRFSDGLRGLRDFNQQGFSREVVEQDIEARWYMLTLEQRAAYREDYIEIQAPERIPRNTGSQRLVAASPTRPNHFILENNPRDESAEPQRAQDRRYQPERPLPRREEPLSPQPESPRLESPQIGQDAESPFERFEPGDHPELADNYFQPGEPLVDLYAEPVSDSRHGSESPERNRDPYAGLTGIITEHSGLFPESRPPPGPLRLQNNPEDFVAYDLPVENLPRPQPRRYWTPNILRRSRPAARRNERIQNSPEYSQNENVGRIVRIQDGERMISPDEWTRRYPRSSSQGQSSRQHARSVSHSNRQRVGGHQSRNHQRYNIAQRPPTLMDLDLSPPRPSPSSPLFSRPPMEVSSPARGSAGVSPSIPPQRTRNETQSGSHEPTRQSEPVPDRPLLDTSSVRTVFRDFGPDPPEDPEERELWNLEQRLMEQRYGTPSKVSPPPEQRILDRSGTPQYSTPRSGPAASREGWTTGSGPISLSNSPAVHFEPLPDFEDDDEESQEETREIRAPAVNGYVRNNSTLAQLRLSTAQNARGRPLVDVTPSEAARNLQLFRRPISNALRDSEEVEDQDDHAPIVNEGLDITDNAQYPDDRVLEYQEVLSSISRDEMDVYLTSIQDGDDSFLNEAEFYEMQGLLAQNIQENPQIQEHDDPQDIEQIEQDETSLDQLETENPQESQQLQEDQPIQATPEPQEAQEPQLSSNIREEMGAMYLSPVQNDDDSFSNLLDCDDLSSTIEPLDADHPISQFLKQG
ncbi:hypothetical protein CAEBREN_21926 [Caenorhabditis brenneri]|uniref:HMG box domain-containing protein n=1 Tax=Caenorhabditis brenneri TaxID=135651 RepID=G0MMF0_CAEBE|nr:hypothetical protein CAEBREN_21926 [Caenorhabditis brenneri]